MSIYDEHLKKNQSETPSDRAKQVMGRANWTYIFRQEVEGKYIKRVQQESNDVKSMAVLGELRLLCNPRALLKKEQCPHALT